LQNISGTHAATWWQKANLPSFGQERVVACVQAGYGCRMASYVFWIEINLFSFKKWFK